MLTAVFFQDPEGRPLGFEIRGHAGYAESGSDIICSAVSALSINAVNSIEALTADAFDAEENEDGFLRLRMEDPSPESQLLLKSLQLGVTDVQRGYGDEFIQIQIKEV